MEAIWLKRESGNSSLALIFLGWAGAPGAAPAEALPPGCDCLCFYDYRTLASHALPQATSYKHIALAAWSFGILAAEHAISGLSVETALAFNGTPRPVDDRLGIPRRAFQVTRRGLPRAGVSLFFERTFGGADKIPSGALPQRSLAELCSELDALHSLAQLPEPGRIAWSKAFVGKRDLIFPPENMRAYWGEKAAEIDTPHYPFANPDLLRRELSAWKLTNN